MTTTATKNYKFYLLNGKVKNSTGKDASDAYQKFLTRPPIKQILKVEEC